MDDLIKNGILKEGKIEENVNLERNRKISGVDGLLILISQAIILFFSFISLIDLGFGGKSGGVLFVFLCVAIFEFFIIKFLIKKKGAFAFILALLCIPSIFFIGSILVTESKLFINDYQFQKEVTLETSAARIEYQKIQNETKAVKIINFDSIGLIMTDKDFRIALTDVSYTPEVIDYLNKNIFGKQFDIIVPEFKSNEYPVSFAYQQWLCQCDILVNGQSLLQILSNLHK